MNNDVDSREISDDNMATSIARVYQSEYFDGFPCAYKQY